MTRPLPVGVLVSGTGTNLRALIDQVHGREVQIVGVVSNDPEAPALEHARAAGIETAVFALDDHDGDRATRDAAIAAWLLERDVGLVVLAGYSQLLTAGFLASFPQAILNVHPALLPAFPGVRAIEQALEYGVKVFGVTVHFIDEGVDTGPIVLQRALELPDAHDPDEVLAELRPLEHELLPAAVRLFARGAIGFDPDDPRRVVIAR